MAVFLWDEFEVLVTTFSIGRARRTKKAEVILVNFNKQLKNNKLKLIYIKVLKSVQLT